MFRTNNWKNIVPSILLMASVSALLAPTILILIYHSVTFVEVNRVIIWAETILITGVLVFSIAKFTYDLRGVKDD